MIGSIVAVRCFLLKWSVFSLFSDVYRAVIIWN
jgi:hypothetical protein